MKIESEFSPDQQPLREKVCEWHIRYRIKFWVYAVFIKKLRNLNTGELAEVFSPKYLFIEIRTFLINLLFYHFKPSLKLYFNSPIIATFNYIINNHIILKVKYKYIYIYNINTI